MNKNYASYLLNIGKNKHNFIHSVFSIFWLHTVSIPLIYILLEADHNFSWYQKKVVDKESRLIPRKIEIYDSLSMAS